MKAIGYAIKNDTDYVLLVAGMKTAKGGDMATVRVGDKVVIRKLGYKVGTDKWLTFDPAL